MIYSIIKFLITVISIMIIGGLLPGVRIKGSSFITATLTAIIIAVLNYLIYPFMVIITLPVTFLTFGLFLLVLNALIIQIASWIVPNFEVDSFGWAFFFGLLLSIITFFLETFIFPIGVFA
ncbi:MAG: phage holin family protein [Bacteroidales bacterium]|nr:phage holin family protein [Bacteroidales bacterium]